MGAPRIVVEGLRKNLTTERDRPLELKERLLQGLWRRRRRRREVQQVLRNVNFSVGEGESLGIIGVNGAGKSTLLKCLAGIMQPSSGRVELRGQVVTLLELGAGFNPALSGRENIFLNASLHGMGRRETEARLESIVEFSGLEDFVDSPLRTYSAGMFLRLGFAVAVHLEPDILLIDEIIAVGDASFQERCVAKLQALRASGKTFVLVSHNLDAIRDLCDHAVLLDAGRIIGRGRPDDVIAVYEQQVSESSAPLLSVGAG